MSKRFSVNGWLPGRGQFSLASLRSDWSEPFVLGGEEIVGWFCVTAELLGFGVSLTYWRHADVYGDGGVA